MSKSYDQLSDSEKLRQFEAVGGTPEKVERALKILEAYINIGYKPSALQRIVDNIRKLQSVYFLDRSKRLIDLMIDQRACLVSRNLALREELKYCCGLLEQHGKTVRTQKEWYRWFMNRVYRAEKKRKQQNGSH